MKNVKLGVRLGGAFALLLLLTVGIAGTSYWGFNSVARNVELADDANRMVKDMGEARLQEKNFIIRGFQTEAGMDQHPGELALAAVDNLEAQLDATLAKLGDSGAEADSIELINTMKSELIAYRDTFQRFIDAETQKIAAREAMQASAQEFVAQLGAFGQSQQQQLDELIQNEADPELIQEQATQNNVADRLQNLLLTSRQAEKNFIISGDETFAAEVDTLTQQIEQGITQQIERSTDASDRSTLQQLENSLLTYKDTFAQYQGLVETQNELNATFISVGRSVEAEAESLRAAKRIESEQTRAFAIWAAIGISLLAVVLGIVIAIVVTRSITAPVERLRVLAQQIAEVDLSHLASELQGLADGDLSRDYTVNAKTIDIDSKDEIGELGRAFNTIIERLQESGQAFDQMSLNLRSLIGQIQQSAEGVASYSSQLSAVAEQTGVATNQIAQTIGYVAQGATQQSTSMEVVRNAIDEQSQATVAIGEGAQQQAEAISQVNTMLNTELAAAIQQVHGSAELGEEAAGAAGSAAVNGSQAVNRTLDGMRAISQSMQTVAERVNEMDRRSQEIGAIINTIEDIAERTNLLALNVAIEAARAGEHGKGFAVVADEVRKLAEQASRSTTEIGRIIEAVQKNAAQTLSAVNTSSEQVNHGMAMADETQAGLEEIQAASNQVESRMSQLTQAVNTMNSVSSNLNRSMEDVAAIVEENTAAVQQLSSSGEQVMSMVAEISAVSEENSASTEEVSASTEEVSAQVIEIVESADHLAQMSKELRGVVQAFKLSASDQKAITQTTGIETTGPGTTGTGTPSTQTRSTQTHNTETSSRKTFGKKATPDASQSNGVHHNGVNKQAAAAQSLEKSVDNAGSEPAEESETSPVRRFSRKSEYAPE